MTPVSPALPFKGVRSQKLKSGSSEISQHSPDIMETRRTVVYYSRTGKSGCPPPYVFSQVVKEPIALETQESTDQLATCRQSLAYPLRGEVRVAHDPGCESSLISGIFGVARPRIVLRGPILDCVSHSATRQEP